MTKEIIINHTSHETRVAVMDGGLLTEVHHEREKVMRVVDLSLIHILTLPTTP